MTRFPNCSTKRHAVGQELLVREGMRDAELLLQVDERVLAVQPRTLEGWRCKGWGPPFGRAGRRVRYRMRDLRAWIEERTFKSTTEADHGREA